MTRWTIISNGTNFGQMSATVEEIQAEFGLEGRDWYRAGHSRRSTIIILRRDKRRKV
jgi:hypothetical protein